MTDTTPARTEAPHPAGRSFLRRAVVVTLVACCAVGLVGVAAATPASAVATPSDRAGANATGGNWTAVVEGGAVTATNGTTTVRLRTLQGSCFPSDAYEGEAGGYVEVSVNCGGYLLIGGDREEGATSVTNFVDVLYIPGGGATFTINTRLLGTDAPSSAVFSSGVVSYDHELPNGARSQPTGQFADLRFEAANGTEIDTLADLRAEMDVSRPPRPLQPKRYRLLMTNGTVVLGDDGIAYAADPVDRSNLRLVQPEIELEEPSAYIAPRGSAASTDALGQLRAVWTERDRVANGDRLVVGGFSTDGLRGTIGYITETEVGTVAPARTGPGFLRELNGAGEGVSLTIEEVDPGPNTDPATLSLDDATEDGLSVVFSDDNEEFYLVIDTRKGGTFDREFSPNATFEVTYTVESTAGERYEFDLPGDGSAPGPFDAAPTPNEAGQYPYFGVDEDVRSVSTEFSVVEPRIRYTRLSRDGEVIVSNEAGERIPGYTNYAPGTDIGLQLISQDGEPPTTIEIEDVVIESDGTFRPAVDLSPLSREYPVEIETFLRERLYDRRAVVLARDPTNPVRFEIGDAPANVTVTQGRPLSALTATIENTGVDDGAQFVTLRAGERLLGNRSVFVPDGENRTIDYESTLANLPVGEYEYVLATEDDEASGSLVVQATPTPTPTTTATPTPATTTAPPTTTVPTSAPTSPTTTAPPATTRPPTGTAAGTPPGTSEPTDSEDDPGFLGQPFLGLGFVAVREVLAGAVVVGAAYVGGYWK